MDASRVLITPGDALLVVAEVVAMSWWMQAVMSPTRRLMSRTEEPEVELIRREMSRASRVRRSAVVTEWSSRDVRRCEAAGEDIGNEGKSERRSDMVGVKERTDELCLKCRVTTVATGRVMLQ